MSTGHQENFSVDQLQTALQEKRQLYQDCDALSLQIGKAVENGESDRVLKLLKRREVIFHRIREVDEHIGKSTDDMERLRTFSRQVPVIAWLCHQIQILIQRIVSADRDVYKLMRAKRTESLNALNQNRHKYRLAIAYRIAGAKIPHFIDSDQ
ncbi:MAG: hypothetical protein O7E52_00490 [Candidatus Poribacteria bacterium]|nr:hypothetical protein [Candidatus Poribacteria bacterium]